MLAANPFRTAPYRCVTSAQIDKYVDDLNANGGKVTHRYGAVLNGFAANIPKNFLNNLQGDSLIKYVEPNGQVSIQPIPQS